MNNYMRIMVFFDLPTGSNDEKREYMHFRKFLLKDGYDMLQYSVYVRLCNGFSDVKKHEDRLMKNLPQFGMVHELVLTEKQYDEKKVLVGERKGFEKRQIKGEVSLF